MLEVSVKFNIIHDTIEVRQSAMKGLLVIGVFQAAVTLT
jgi:hypothetical protein